MSLMNEAEESWAYQGIEPKALVKRLNQKEKSDLRRCFHAEGDGPDCLIDYIDEYTSGVPTDTRAFRLLFGQLKQTLSRKELLDLRAILSNDFLRDELIDALHMRFR